MSQQRHFLEWRLTDIYISPAKPRVVVSQYPTSTKMYIIAYAHSLGSPRFPHARTPKYKQSQ